jgi:hypothetical protein
MTDPYCGWNIRKNTCENSKSNNNLIVLNSNLCSRFQRQDNIKQIQVESGANIKLECGIVDDYLFNFVEWSKDQVLIQLHPNYKNNMLLTDNKGNFILSLIFIREKYLIYIYMKLKIYRSGHFIWE